MAGRQVASCLALLALVVIGCDEHGERFAVDRPLHLAVGLAVEQTDSVRAALEELFGTPEAPRLPAAPRIGELLSLDALQQAAGAVISEEVGVTQGLYRRHCARCHGMTGDGMGPTSLYQHPYPRDFRHGVFKWKSTYRSAKPTTMDLDRVLKSGVPGTAMPSFRLLTDEERSILRQYVVFLSLRGELERELVWFVSEELDPGATLDLTDKETNALVLLELLEPIIAGWLKAEQQVVQTEVFDSPHDLDLLSLGMELYASERAGCVKCHGPAGQGGVSPERDYDVWTRERVEFATQSGAELADALSRTLPIKESDAPRLAGERPRGGAAPLDLFRRLHQGIAGTAMPAVGPRASGEAGALTDEEILALTMYVRSIMSVEEGGL